MITGRSFEARFPRFPIPGLFWALSGILLTGSVSFGGISYELTDLGVLPGAGNANPAAINNAGQIVGSSASNVSQAFLYSDGSMQVIPTPGTNSTASGINASGQVVGNFGTGAAGGAFLYIGGSAQTLNGISTANAINDSGQVVGESGSSAGSTHAFLYSGGSGQDLGTLGGAYSSARAINNAGQIVGSASLPGGASHAFLYSGGSMHDLGTLGGTTSEAAAINDLGQVVGDSLLADNRSIDIFLYTGSAMVDLGNLGLPLGQALGINDAGEVVGYSRTSTGGALHAFVYADGTMYDLNSLLANPMGYTVEDATAINARGDIVAFGVSPAGEYRALLLTPSGGFTPSAVPTLPAVWASLTALPLLLCRRWLGRVFA